MFLEDKEEKNSAKQHCLKNYKTGKILKISNFKQS